MQSIKFGKKSFSSSTNTCWRKNPQTAKQQRVVGFRVQICVNFFVTTFSLEYYSAAIVPIYKQVRRKFWQITIVVDYQGLGFSDQVLVIGWFAKFVVAETFIFFSAYAPVLQHDLRRKQVRWFLSFHSS